MDAAHAAVSPVADAHYFRLYGTRWVILAIIFLLQIACGLVRALCRLPLHPALTPLSVATTDVCARH